MTQLKFKPLDPRKVGLLVVHCSATKPSMNWGAAEIDREHRKRGFFGIGYHYVIKRDGTVELGRPLDRQGSHVKGYNHLSVGVVMIGGVSERDVEVPENNFTAAQFASLKSVLAGLKTRFPGAEIIGHGQIPGVRKACPSFDAVAWAKATGLS